MTCIQQTRARAIARGVEHCLQLMPAWMPASERACAEPRRTRLSLSISAALMAGLVAWPTVGAAVLYVEPITGVAGNDGPGGTGGYDPAYDVSFIDGALHYAFAGGDSIEMEDVDRDLLTVSIASGNPPVALDVVGGGWMDLSASRGESVIRGTAIGILNDGNTVTVNGNTRISARARDADFGGGLGNSAQAVLARGGSTTVFNGATDLHAHTQGFARAVWVMGRSNVVFNGPTTILAESRGTLDAVYNSDGGTITFSGDTNISALSIWPSDNAHAIYNDNVNTRLTVNGNLSLTTVAMGSTAFGVRNQGDMEVFGDATVNVRGPRSTHGIANTHRSAWMRWHGDVDVLVRSEGPENGYTPFGRPSGLSNDRSPGAVMTFDGAVSVDVASETETYGLVSTGLIEFTSPTAPVSFTVANVCNPPDHPSCDDADVYGIRNFGTVNVAGGLTVSTTAGRTGTAYSIWSVPLDIQDASVTVNQAGGQRVQLDGDIATATDPVNDNTGSVNINFDTADSWLRGSVGGHLTDTGFSVGQADLAFTNGATWTPQGTGTLANDFGSGSLALGDNGVIDMAGYWGSFAPGSIPTYSHRTLSIGSSTSGASVSLADGARFQLLSDITGIKGTARADKIVFGSGISSFSASGIQGVSIVYDPVLDDSSWVNATTLRSGIRIQAATPIEIVDASAAAGGSATFAAATGLDGAWSGTYEGDLVSFAYTPQVALSTDGKKILLSGISIQGSESGAVPSVVQVPGSIGAVSAPLGLRPSETVLSAADAADSIVDLWQNSGQASLRHLRERSRRQGADQASVWAKTDGGALSADSAYARDYRQNYNGLTVGADRSFARDADSTAIGFSIAQIRSTANYEQGKGELKGTTLGLYSGWAADSGPYLLLGADVSLLENRYSARDSQNREIVGKYRTQAVRTYAEGGYPFELANGYYIEPQLGLSVGTIRGNRHTTRNGVQIDQDRLVSSVARAGVEIGKSLRGAGINGGLYVRASALHYQGDNLDISASKDGGSIAPDTAERKGMGSEWVLGGDAGFGNTRLFIEASSATVVDAERNWAVQAGLRHNW